MATTRVVTGRANGTSSRVVTEQEKAEIYMKGREARIPGFKQLLDAAVSEPTILNMNRLLAAVERSGALLRKDHDTAVFEQRTVH